MNTEDITAPAGVSYTGGADGPITARVDAALSRCDELLTAVGADVALDRLVRELSDVRAAAPSPEHWRTAVVATRAHPAQWMVYRSDADMRALGTTVESAVPGTEAMVYSLADGRVACLLLRARSIPDCDR